MAAPWRTSEQTILIDEIRRRARAASEILIPGRSAGAVRRKASRLKLVGDGIPRRPWSAADRDTLRRLRDEGWTVARMCAGPLAAYTPTAVQKQIRRLGLADPRYALPQQRAHRLAGPKLEQFHAFLTAHARTCTPEQIAAAWNDEHQPTVNHGRVLYHLEQLGLRAPRQLVLRMAFSKEKRRRSQGRSLSALRAYSDALPVQTELRMRERAEELRAAGDANVVWQSCLECDAEWPHTDEFFHASRKSSANGEEGGAPRTYLLRRCKLCCNRARRAVAPGAPAADTGVLAAATAANRDTAHGGGRTRPGGAAAAATAAKPASPFQWSGAPAHWAVARTATPPDAARADGQEHLV